MKDLKPCPFCGGQPEDCDVSDYFVVCPSCCIEGPHSVDNSRAQAVKEWNTRAQAPAAEPLTETPTAWAVRSVSANFLGLYSTEGHARSMMADRSRPDDAELVPLHERAHGIGTAAAPVTLTDDARDAARYRWLREENQKVAGPAAYAPWGGEIMFGAELDAALDKALAAAKEQP
jgi:Lar family restriction alleviation protein